MTKRITRKNLTVELPVGEVFGHEEDHDFGKESLPAPDALYAVRLVPTVVDRHTTRVINKHTRHKVQNSTV